MSVNEIIMNALNGIVKDIWPMVCPRAKPPEEYIVFNPEYDEPTDFGDNEPHEWILHMQIHYFVVEDEDYTEMRRQIRKALMTAGFAIDEITTMHESDSGYNHLCFSCSIEEQMEE